MPYVTGGYATTRLSTRDFNTPAGTLAERSEERHDGWYIGGGVEWMLSKNLILGAEYRHYDFGSEVHAAVSPAGALVPADNKNVDLSSDSLVARLSYKFGREEAYRPLK